jgi:hypothetical protein
MDGEDYGQVQNIVHFTQNSLKTLQRHINTHTLATPLVLH